MSVWQHPQPTTIIITDSLVCDILDLMLLLLKCVINSSLYGNVILNTVGVRGHRWSIYCPPPSLTADWLCCKYKTYISVLHLEIVENFFHDQYKKAMNYRAETVEQIWMLLLREAPVAACLLLLHLVITPCVITQGVIRSRHSDCRMIFKDIGFCQFVLICGLREQRWGLMSSLVPGGSQLLGCKMRAWVCMYVPQS